LPSKKIPVDTIYAAAKALLDEHKEIIFESTLCNLLGVSSNWFYANLMANEEYSQDIKRRLRENRGSEALSSLRACKASDAPACIIARMKMSDYGMREALNADKEEKTQERDIIINIPGEMIEKAKKDE
jgi:Xaa-Pro aminopeptidase